MKTLPTLLFSLLSFAAFSQDQLGAFNAVEQMPSWASCQHGDDTHIRSCTVDEIQMHLIMSMDMSPTEMASMKDQMLMIRFVVDSKGNVKKPEVLGGTGGKGESALVKAVNKLPPMNPGLHQGRPVDVLYVIPFRVKG